LSDVGRHLHSQNELSIRLSLSSRLATDFSALAPARRAGAQRVSALAHPRHFAAEQQLGRFWREADIDW
jgi:hypothetical protein